MSSAIEFCPNCNNMLYLVMTSLDGNTANAHPTKKCRQCAYIADISSDDVIEIGAEYVDKGTLIREKFMNNKFIENDITIPRVTVNCSKCSSEQSALYIVYDAENMQSMLKCLKCKSWLDCSA